MPRTLRTYLVSMVITIAQIQRKNVIKNNNVLRRLISIWKSIIKIGFIMSNTYLIDATLYSLTHRYKVYTSMMICLADKGSAKIIQSGGRKEFGITCE